MPGRRLAYHKAHEHPSRVATNGSAAPIKTRVSVMSYFVRQLLMVLPHQPTNNTDCLRNKTVGKTASQTQTIQPHNLRQSYAYVPHHLAGAITPMITTGQKISSKSPASRQQVASKSPANC
jgi:hypothetical protein